MLKNSLCAMLRATFIEKTGYVEAWLVMNFRLSRYPETQTLFVGFAYSFFE